MFPLRTYNPVVYLLDLAHLISTPHEAFLNLTFQESLNTFRFILQPQHGYQHGEPAGAPS